MTDSKTATERLREMLDARGVEYEANRIDFDDGNFNIFTEWGDEGNYSYVEYSDGPVFRMFGCTPEQAVAATLGSNAKPCYATDYTHEHCKYSVNRGWLEDTKFYIPTPDTLGSGECEFVIEDNMNETEGMGDVWFRCTGCDMTYDYYADDWLMKMNYCPNCGAKVVNP